MASARWPDRPADRRRGQPLAFLTTVIVLWSLARVAQHLPGDEPAIGSVRVAPPSLAKSAPLSSAAVAEAELPVVPLLPIVLVSGPTSRSRDRLAALPPAPPRTPAFDAMMTHQQLWVESLALSAGHGAAPDRGSPLTDRPLMLVPEPPAAQSTPEPGLPPGVRVVRPGRWSVYGWSLLRQGGRARTLAPVPQYGASQAGLVVQLALTETEHRPLVYARASSALGNAQDRSVALGVSARPFPGLPVDLAVERRLGLARGQPDRFAAMLVGGAARTVRQGRLRLEGYGQAGVVGLADRHAFFDLQMLASRPVHVTDAQMVSLGGGVWAGGQQGQDAQGRKRWTHRIDLGPRAAIAVPVERGSLQLALDWRQRIDGDADPASGAALTLSAGF